MQQIVKPADRLSGVVRLPGDKSISHRYAMVAAIAKGRSHIQNYSTGADCQSTLDCLGALGAPVRREQGAVHIDGSGLHGLSAPQGRLDAGNSGSTIRMLSGILAGQTFRSEIGGDNSLTQRPMRRIIEPLSQMGAHVEAREGNFPPLAILGGRLKAIDYTLPVASAQVKTAILFAGLYAEGETVVRESVRTRDHTEIALHEFGADIDARLGEIRLRGGAGLQGRDLQVPSDLSSAAFFIVAGLLVPNSEVLISGVGLNPTRTTLLDVLSAMGGRIKILEVRQAAGELVGDLLIKSSEIRGGQIAGATTAAVIDEIPALAVLGAVSREGLVIRDARELRVKESDRIMTIAANLGRLGVDPKVSDDGLEIPGRARFRSAQLDSFGDHRIAMAFSIAALLADGPCTMCNSEAAAVSFPEFYTTLVGLRA